MRGTEYPNPSSAADTEAAPAADLRDREGMAGAGGPPAELPSETADPGHSAGAPETSTSDNPAQGITVPAAAPPPQTRARTRGVADIVFLIDISGSMRPCIDALRRNIETFVDS